MFFCFLVFLISVCSEDLNKCYVHFKLNERKTWKEESSICHAGGFTLPNIHKREEMKFMRKWMHAVHQYEVYLRNRQIFLSYIGTL